MATYDLSYLIRLGAGKHPQCCGEFYRGLGPEHIEATCALGAARVALASLTGVSFDDTFQAILDAADAAARLGVQIVSLNDRRNGLTREAIADRLDALPGGSPVVTVP
jgi:hypothetical protein